MTKDREIEELQRLSRSITDKLEVALSRVDEMKTFADVNDLEAMAFLRHLEVAEPEIYSKYREIIRSISYRRSQSDILRNNSLRDKL